MAIYFYDRGEHPGQFIGFRVCVSVEGVSKQAYFKVADTRESSLDYKQQKLAAYKQAAQWIEEAANAQYERIVTQTSPRTLEGRGVGVHGITMTFTEKKRSNIDGKSGKSKGSEGKGVIAGFTVHCGNMHCGKANAKGSCFIPILNDGYTSAWEKAVNLWARRFQIQDVDRKRVMDKPPSPEQFKALRRIENEQRGADIPVDALHYVFLEQRERIMRKRMAHKASGQTFKALTGAAASADGLSPSNNVNQKEGEACGSENDAEPEPISAEIISWFEKEAKRYM